MTYNYFSLNGKILPIDQAKVDLSDIHYAYGFGVYETIKCTKQIVFFLESHAERLLKSAEIIGLEHEFSANFVVESVKSLVNKLEPEACNVKIMLVGGQTKKDAKLYIMCLNRLFPDRSLYKKGVKCTTFNYERDFVQAKSMNMMPSYIAYKQARAVGAYDALLVNRDGYITEGSRTNFFTIKDKTIFSPPEDQILPGVTRYNILTVAAQNGYAISETNISLDNILDFDGAFISNTSSKIMPINQIDETKLEPIPSELKNLMSLFDQFLENYTTNNKVI